eukprot:scaffold93960_cov29-Prasinocladus_malaysianus.AAC.1
MVSNTQMVSNEQIQLSTLSCRKSPQVVVHSLAETSVSPSLSQIMVPNGVTHQQVPDDQAGVEAILKWLSYIPATNRMLAPIVPTADPVDRDVGFTPTKPYTAPMPCGDWCPFWRG